MSNDRDPDVEPGDPAVDPAEEPLRPFVVVLVLVAAVVVTQGAFPESPWSRFVQVMVLGATLMSALALGHAVRGLRIAAIVWIGLVAAMALGTDVSGELDEQAAGIVLLANGLLVALAPPAILAAVRRQHRVTMHAVFAAMSIYLLLGSFFAFVYRAIEQFSPGSFVDPEGPMVPATFQYLSFITLATVGFGDVRPVSQLARTLTMTEGLIGQLYLVTVVALVVGNLGHQIRRDPSRPRSR
jgi:hypothetical protein